MSMVVSSMYINLKQIWKDYPDDYDKICELYCKLMMGNKTEREKSKLALKEYGLL